jgi:hypothetical protein
MKPWKYIVIIVALVIVVVIILAMFLQAKSDLRQSQQAFGNVQLANTILTKTRDKLNREVSTYKAFQFTMSELNSMQDSTILALKNSVSYWKGLVSHTSIGSITTDTNHHVPVIDSTVHHGDSAFTVHKFTWEDKWLTLHGKVYPTYADIDYSIGNNTSVDYYWQRKHWWTKPEMMGTVTQDNPHTTTGKVVQFTIVSPQNKWYEKWWVHALFWGGCGIAADHYLLK